MKYLFSNMIVVVVHRGILEEHIRQTILSWQWKLFLCLKLYNKVICWENLTKIISSKLLNQGSTGYTSNILRCHQILLFVAMQNLIIRKQDANQQYFSTWKWRIYKLLAQRWSTHVIPYSFLYQNTSSYMFVITFP